MEKARPHRKDQRVVLLSESLTRCLAATHPGALAELSAHAPPARRPLSFGTRKLNWREKLLAEIRKRLGAFPQRCPLNPEIVERKKFPTHIREKVIFDSERFMSVPAWVCSPRVRERNRKLPAVICSHGEGPGKDPLVGLCNGEKCLEYHKLIAVRLAEQGYVSITPDWRLFGDRAEPVQPSGAPGDLSKILRIAEEQLDYTLMGLNVWDGLRTLDYLTSRDDVDPAAIGCLGVCLGAHIAVLLALCDRRIAAVALSGYLGTEGDKLLAGDWVNRNSEAFPGLHEQAAAADVAGLLAPRPLLIQNGEYDEPHLSSAGAEKAFSLVRKIYGAAGAADRLERDFFDGGYEINVPPIVQFFNRRLKGTRDA